MAFHSHTAWKRLSLGFALVAAATAAWWVYNPSPAVGFGPAKADNSSEQPSCDAGATQDRSSAMDATDVRVEERPAVNASQAQHATDLAAYLCTGQSCGATPIRDPMAADSLEEAAWMRDRAFPTRLQREIAQSMDVDSVLRLAEAERSAALRILGLERKLAETEDPSVMEEVRRELMLRARQRRELYALYGEFEANLRLAEMAIQANRSATEPLMAAMFAARLAVMLGDHKAARLYARLPPELATANRWSLVDEHVLLFLQRGSGQPSMLNMQSYSYRPSLDERPASAVGQTPRSTPGG